MLNSIIGKKTVYIVTGYTDMRKGIDGLAEIVQGKLSLDPYSKALFLFCGKNPRK
ncbi:MAG: IS66 family insertion sequence element accessory protein TnpB, partial [Oscillospiraceae bacterium]|nr:IS66 family insertion sequence element accessory protein TnpB [Oscillospiraceae bacterium]